jgi:transcriptional regulator with XRE-family HTH domain
MNPSPNVEERYRRACGAVIGRLRAQQGWSLRDFGQQVGAAHTTLYAIERGDAVPGIEILDHVAVACGLDLPALLRLIVDELATTPSGGTTNLGAIVTAAGDLSAAQRRDLLGFVDYLRYRDRDQPA